MNEHNDKEGYNVYINIKENITFYQKITANRND